MQFLFMINNDISSLPYFSRSINKIYIDEENEYLFSNNLTCDFFFVILVIFNLLYLNQNLYYFFKHKP